jgi:nitrate reductase NapE component
VASRRPDGLAVFVLPRVLDPNRKEKIMNSPDEPEEQQRQIKIDADIDEVIKTIQGLGLKPDESCGRNPSPKRNRWMRLAVITVTSFAIGAFAGLVGAYTFNAVNGAGDIRVIRPWEIRRAIPVEPEIRRAIPVEPEIRKAIPVHAHR